MEKLTPEHKDYWVHLRDDLQAELVRIFEENKRMRGALRWYKERACGLYVTLHGPNGWVCNVASRDLSELCADAGKRAREALGEDS